MKKILITGAANGIGKHLAEIYSKRGDTLILWDKDEQSLNRVVHYLHDTYKNKVYSAKVDISKKEEIGSQFNVMLYFRIEDMGMPDIVINNVGIGLNKELSEVSREEWRKLFEVNFFSALDITTRMIAATSAYRRIRDNNKRTQIVNICSGQIFFKLPTWTAYATTKAALSAFSEALHIEAKKDGIDVTTVYPFMVNTGFYKGVEENAPTWVSKMSMKLLPLYSQKPETVANIIVKAIDKKKPVEMVHPINWIGYYLDTVPMMGRIVRRMMNKFLAG